MTERAVLPGGWIAIERLLSDDPLGPALSAAVIEDLRVVIAHARRLSERAKLQSAVRRDAA